MLWEAESCSRAAGSLDLPPTLLAGCGVNPLHPSTLQKHGHYSLQKVKLSNSALGHQTQGGPGWECGWAK